MNKHPVPTFSPEERRVMLEKMAAAADEFYFAAIQIGCHPFIEFAGLMNEYIKICHRAHADGLDFNLCSAHSGIALPMKDFEARYLGEKLGCIYGPSVSDPKLAGPLLEEMGIKP